MPFQAVFLSTIIATVVSTLVMGLFRKRSLRISTRDGVECVLYIYSCLRPWIHLAEALAMVFILVYSIFSLL